MTIPLSQRFEILQRDGFTCRFCGQRAPETELEVDHLHPRAKGRSDDAANLVTACRNCNRGKGDRLVVLAGKNGWTSLVGKFFHQFTHIEGQGRRINQQGVVVADLGGGFFMVGHFEWIAGTRSFTGTQIVALREMAAEKWAWYLDDEQMRDSYRYSGLAIRDDWNGPASQVEVTA